MIVLTILACLTNEPSDCRKHTLPFDGPAFACIVSGQFTVAEWAASHPKYRVARFTCGPAKQDA